MDKKIVVSKNGPYLVSGEIPLSMQTITPNDEGESTSWQEGKTISATASYALCRCGDSHKKPFCDGTHVKKNFDGTETASHEPILKQSKIYDGPKMQLADAEHLCAGARFCDPYGQVWNQVEASDDKNVREQFIKQVSNCPAGRLMAINKGTGEVLEPKLSPSIGTVQDPGEECSGPLWVRGGIPIVSADGQTYEVRNRVTLCRCGRSGNKPFCNGAHAADPKFKE